jgi:predicted nucleic-acid-binding Zn-ribbon protein
MNQILKYNCPKCGNKQYEIGEMWTFRSYWSKIFELGSRRFTFISCQNCRFTEIYKVPLKEIGEVLNFKAGKSSE